MRWRDGLVVGKFAPLHRGHEALIEFARSQCQRVWLLSYSNPELPGCGPERRRRWLAARFPDCPQLVIDEQWLASARDDAGQPLPPLPANSSSDEAQQQWFVQLLTRVLHWPVDALFGSEPWLAPTARRLGSASGWPVAAVSFDPERRAVPVSGSALRADPHGLRQFLAPEVYADFVERVVLLGGESTGKSTLSAALAEALGTGHVAEYGRDHWLACNGQLTPADLNLIAREQLRREQLAAASANRVLICDTSPLTTLCYAEALFGGGDAELQQLANQPYALQLLLSPDFPLVQDGTRRDEPFRHWQHQWHLAQLARRPSPWLPLGGPLAARLAHAKLLLGNRVKPTQFT